MTKKTLKSQKDTFHKVILWNRKTGLRNEHEFGDGTEEAIRMEGFLQMAREAIRAGLGPYEQVTLEQQTLTTWEAI